MNISHQISQLQAIQDDLQSKYFKVVYLPPDENGDRKPRTFTGEDHEVLKKCLTQHTEAHIAVRKAIEALSAIHNERQYMKLEKQLAADNVKLNEYSIIHGSRKL